MEYISAQTLDKAYSKEGMIEKGIFQKMGQILQQMHTVTASGYGFPTKDGIGKYKEFKTWLLENPQTKNQINYVQKYNLLPEEKYGSLEETLKLFLIMLITILEVFIVIMIFLQEIFLTRSR